MHSKNITICFDATTIDRHHINSIQITTMEKAIAVDTSFDYKGHICRSTYYLASVYADFNSEDFQICRSKIISNVSNTLTDRLAAYHLAIAKLCETWGKSLNELNCHLHPLETVATACQTALRNAEPVLGQLFGKHGLPVNIVLAINKLWFKDGKADPKGFKAFLEANNLKKGFISRYWGNRFHILFRIYGKVFQHHRAFHKYFSCKSGFACCGLIKALVEDFDNHVPKTELQVLGLLGKTLRTLDEKFYTAGCGKLKQVDAMQLEVFLGSSIGFAEIDSWLFGGVIGWRWCSLRTTVSPRRWGVIHAYVGKLHLGCGYGFAETVKKVFFHDLVKWFKNRDPIHTFAQHGCWRGYGKPQATKEKASNSMTLFLSAQVRNPKNDVVGFWGAMP